MPILSNSFAELSITAVLGYAVVFLGIILLMIVVSIIGKIFTASSKKAAPVVESTREKLGDLAKTDEDVLSYIAFPNLAEKFLEDRKAKEENVVTYSIVEA